MKKIVVLGRGYLGSEFEKNGFEVWGKDKFHPNPLSGYAYHALNDVDIVINCIGKSNTRWCEKQENWEQVMYSNYHIPAYLSSYCARRNKKLVHISTGCLYDAENCKETDFLTAHCAYTVSKFAAEMALRPKRDLILRPRLYFDDTVNDKNLLCKLPKFKQYTFDRYDSFTSLRVIVEATKALIDANQTGIFNVACDGTATIYNLANWCGLANSVSEQGIKAEDLRKQEKLYLVNNTMNIEKLKPFYRPPQLREEILACWGRIHC